MKKLAIILNGISLEKKFFYHRVFPALNKNFTVELFETRSRNDAFTLASKAVDKQFDVLLAAGGDGTIHQVVNGMLDGRESHKDLPVLGVIPIGTGNDFARSLKVEADPDQLLALLTEHTPKNIDVGVVEYIAEDGSKDNRYFVNVADAGMGPEVVKKVLASGRPMGSAVAYYLAILSTFFTYKPMNVTATTPSWSWKGKMRTFAVANGKYYGHGLCIAPDAKPYDNTLDTFICGDVSVLDFIRHSGPLKKGQYVQHKGVSYKKENSIELYSEAPCRVEADGELLGWLPAKIEMTPIKLRILAP